MRISGGGKTTEGVTGKPIMKVVEANTRAVEVVRTIEDLTIKCRISVGSREDWKINTGIKSFDKILHIFAQYSKLNLNINVEAKSLKPTTWLIGNIGRTLGEVLNIMARERSKTVGMKAFGYSQGLCEEAFVEVRILLAGRGGCWITKGPNLKSFGRIGEVSEEAVKLFFTEFAQAIKGTLHIDLIRGESPYTLWYAAFMAFGEALRQAFTEDEWNKKQTTVEPIA